MGRAGGASQPERAGPDAGGRRLPDLSSAPTADGQSREVCTPDLGPSARDRTGPRGGADHRLQICTHKCMQICMKLGPEAIGQLGVAMRARREGLGMQVAEVARESGVHASQVSRILLGPFRTLSYSVMRICTVLGIDPETAKEAERPAGPEPDRAARHLQQRLLAAWDRTPADAERLSRFLDQLA